VTLTVLTTPGRVAKRGRARTATTTALLAAVEVAVSVASVLTGSRQLPLAGLLDSDHPAHTVYDARLARTGLALAVGAALGLAGALMQGLTRNPLADPGLLGVHAGASLAMVLGITYLGVAELSAYLWFALAGAAVAAVAVHAIAALGRDGATPVKLAIAGAALTAALTSWTSGVLLTNRETLEVFRLWQVGTVGGRGYDVLLTGLPFLVVGGLLALASPRLLNALALGDDVARAIGRRTAVDRAVVGLAIVLLAGVATALAGPIAFVGLIVPHAVRAPTEVQVGIMTAVVGVPVFLVLVRRGRMGSL
jgi:iron complex transport system permease protein